MNKIGTFEDFKHFAKANVGVNEEKIKNFAYPTIVEERTAAMRAVEMNVFSRLIQDRIIFLSGDVNAD